MLQKLFIFTKKRHFAAPLKENKTFLGITLLRSGYLPHVALDLLFGAPPTYSSEETSFMDGPLGQLLTELRRKKVFSS